MVTHHITAAHDGLFWRIAMNREGDIIERKHQVTNDLDSHIECSCGETFETQDESIDHLKEIENSDNGESVTRHPDGIKVETTEEHHA